MNSRSISISIVGKDTDPCTPEQDKALVSLISYLTETYKIRPDQVLDYGCVAYPYGRRNTQPNLPWQLLAKHQLALWPNPKDIENTNVIFRLPIIEKHWTAAALIKVGFICPLTGNDLNNDFVSALKTFQQHYQCDNQEGVVTPNTIAILNSILIQHEQLNPKLKDISPPSLPLFYNDIKGILTAIKKQNI